MIKEQILANIYSGNSIGIIRLLLALAAKSIWEVPHLDVKTAFLNGKITEEVYVSQPKGFIVE